jgi:Rha family phage regulatory protein
MLELNIIKRNGGAYIDSREVAELIGKRHDHLLRDIGKYREILARGGLPKIGESDFFLESCYLNAQNKVMPCYLISKRGAEVIANKLTGENGVLFTFAYVSKFNEMEAAEQMQEIKALGKPHLRDFNGAVKNVLSGMAYAYETPNRVMNFLRGVYNPLGIEVLEDGVKGNFYTATEIASLFGILSETGRPHAHAISAIISKLNIHKSHMVAIPFGLVGVAFRYDAVVVEAVVEWLIKNRFPHEVPYLGFEYHIYYRPYGTQPDADGDDFVIDLDGGESGGYTSDELDIMCVMHDDCDDCPGRRVCCSDEK